MTCSRVRTLLPLYEDKSLGSKEMAEVEEHLAHCTECRRRLSLDRELGAALASLPAPEAVAMSPRLRRRVMADVERRQHKRPVWWLMGATANAVTAVCGVALIGFLVVALGVMSQSMTARTAGQTQEAVLAMSTSTPLPSQPADDLSGRAKKANRERSVRGQVDLQATGADAAPDLEPIGLGEDGPAISGTEDSSTRAKVATVERFYRLIAQRQYSKAYQYLSPAFQESNPYPDWLAGYTTTLQVQESVQAGPAGSVEVLLIATDRTKDGGPQVRHFHGRWFLSFSEGHNQWLLDRAEIEEVPGESVAQTTGFRP